jgi:hypothetical protein
LFISHLFALSGMALIIDVIFDMSEHISMCAEAGLSVKTAATRTSGYAAYFMFELLDRKGFWNPSARQGTPPGRHSGLIWRKP